MSSPVQAPRNGSLYSSKIEGLQILRAVAVLLVTWLHSVQLSDSFFSRPFNPEGTFRVANLGMFGVDIFFAISGFILTMVTLRPTDARPVRQAYTFFTRRLIRIYPIYWILLLLPVGRLLHQHRLHAGVLVRSLLLLPGLRVPIATPLISYAWTLTFEMFFYATMTGLILINPLKAAQKTVWTLLGFVLLGVLFGIHRPVLVLVSNPILVEFVAGATLAIWFNDALRRWNAAADGRLSPAPIRLGWTLLLTGVAYTAFVTWAFPANSSLEHNTTFGLHGWARVATWGVAGWLLAAGTVFLSTGLQAKRRRAELNPLSRLAIFLGDASYSIYLSSALTMEQIGRVMEHIHPPTVPSQILIGSTTVLTTLLVVLVGCLFHVGIERPLTTWLHREMHSRPFGMARLPAAQTR